MRLLATAIAALTTLTAPTVRADEAATSLIPVLQSRLIFNGVATSADGRIFLPFQRQQPGQGIEVGEWVDGQAKGFPDAAWNDFPNTGDPAHGFVGVNALRIGPDGQLWIVDKGAPGPGKDVLPGGAKVVVVDLETNKVSKVIPLDAVTGKKSFVDDIRFNGNHAYLTDAGQPGLIVLDLASGRMWRALDGDRSVTQERTLMAEGKPLVDPKGKPVVINADQLEVSPDGTTFYFQACTGPLYRIATRWLDDPGISDQDRVQHVALFADTPSTGGTAIDAAGNIYSSDTDHSRILKIAPDGTTTTLVADPRLAWVDAMWIDDAGFLYMPASQLNRTPAQNHGVDAVQLPTTVYKMQIGGKPVRR